MHRDDAAREQQILSSLRIGTDGHGPDRQSESGQAAGRRAAVGSHENGGRLEIFKTRFDSDRNQVQRQDLAREIDVRIHLLDRRSAPGGLDRRGNPREHRHRLDGEIAHRGFGGQHHAIGAIEDGIGHVGGLGASWQIVMDHGLQHLRGRDHRLRPAIGLANKVLLDDGDLFDRHFHAQIPARNHDPVGGVEDFVDAFQRALAFDLRDEKWLTANVAGRLANSFQIRSAFDE